MVLAHVRFSPSELSWTRVNTHLGLLRAVLDPKWEPELVRKFNKNGFNFGSIFGIGFGSPEEQLLDG